MLKKTKLSVIDNKYLGDEPKVTESSSASNMINAYNWFNYFYTTDDAKDFVVQYLKQQKFNKKIISNIQEVSSLKLANIGWNCKLLLSGNTLPIDIHSKMLHKIHTLSSQVKKTQPVAIKPIVKIQTYIENKFNKIIAELEEQLDIISTSGNSDFNVQSYFRTIALKAHVAKSIVAYYKPLYSEVYDAIKGDDPELKYAYRNWKKKELKIYLNYISDIISSAEVFCTVAIKIRKPRKKKDKPATVIIAKMKYKQEDTEYKIKSIKPTDVIGANQLWLFNTKYRTLTVLNTMSHAGLSVKGTTVTGFDEKTSITKKLRKPEVTLTAINNAGKVSLRKMMDNIKCKPKSATGRINSDTIILRAVK